tara:strand:+ start:287 stop:637 length:351 start_codon:yes stop_codon:yes gene_type:complete
MYYKQDEIAQHFQDYLTENRPWQQWLDGTRSDFEPSELHHEAFNTDYYIIGTYRATQWLGDRAFEVIGIIKDYEQANFGKVCTDLSSPEAVVNMYAYIVGELVVSNWFAELERAVA